MWRKVFLKRVGQQEKADPQEEAHIRAVFAAPDGAVSGGEMRDIGRQFLSEFGPLFG